MGRDFNGNTDRLYYGNVLDPAAQAQSFAGWIWPDAYSTGWHDVYFAAYKWGDSSLALFVYDMMNTGGKVALEIDYSLQNQIRRTNAGALSTGQWNQLTVTWDGSTSAAGIHIYVDGSEASYDPAYVQDGSGTPVSGDGSWFLASLAPDELGLDGKMAEVGWWNRVLTGGEIAVLSKGFSPLCFPRGLKFAPPLVRGVEDPISGKASTLTGSSVFPHVTTRHPMGAHLGFKTAGPGPSRLPWHLFAGRAA